MTTYIGIALSLFLAAYLGWLIGIIQGFKAGEQAYDDILAELDQVKAERDGYKAPFTALKRASSMAILRARAFRLMRPLEKQRKTYPRPSPSPRAIYAGCSTCRKVFWPRPTRNHFGA